MISLCLRQNTPLTPIPVAGFGSAILTPVDMGVCMPTAKAGGGLIGFFMNASMARYQKHMTLITCVVIVLVSILIILSLLLLQPTSGAAIALRLRKLLQTRSVNCVKLNTHHIKNSASGLVLAALWPATSALVAGGATMTKYH